MARQPPWLVTRAGDAVRLPCLLLALLLAVAVPLPLHAAIVASPAVAVVPRGATAEQDDSSPLHRAAEAALVRWAAEHENVTITRLPAEVVGGFGAWSVHVAPLLASPLAPAFFPIYPGYQPFISALESSLADVRAAEAGVSSSDQTCEDMLLLDIEDLLDEMGVLDNLPLSMRRLVTDRKTGRVRAVPYYGDADAIFCPRDVLIKLDGSYGPPETYEEFLDVLRRSDRRYGIGLNLYTSGQLVTSLLVAMHGGEFALKVVHGDVDMTSDAMIELGEKTVDLFASGLIKPAGTGEDFSDMFLFGTRGCMMISSNIYAEFGVDRPAVFAEPFYLPRVPSRTGPATLEVKSGVGFPVVSFVPALSSQRDLGASMLRYSIQARLDLAKRGPPFTADEEAFLGKSLLFFDRETLTSSPVYADALKNYDAMSALDYLVTSLGPGSPPQLVDDHIRLFDSLYSAQTSPIDPAVLMHELEKVRIEKLHRRTLSPSADLPEGEYDGPLVITFTTSTPDATISYTTDGSEVGVDAALSGDGTITLSQEGKTVLRVAAKAPFLDLSSEVRLEFTIRMGSTDTTAVVLSVVLIGVILVLLSAAGVFFLHRRRKHGQFIDPRLVQLDQVIGIGGRSIVFFGNFRGTSVAVKEFVPASRLEELIRDGTLASSNANTLTVGDLLSRNRSAFASSTSLLIDRLRSDSNLSQEPLTGGGLQTARARKASERRRGEEFLREIQLLSKVRHPNIVTFLAAYDSNGRRGIVLEFMSRGSLFEVVTGSANVLSWRQRISFARDAARGLAFLHAQTPPILHRDVKSLNFLVGDHGQCAVSDFGFSTIFEESTQMGTLPWMAPEVLRGELYTQACDVYSFGIVLWELASRTAPSLGRSSAAIRSDTLSGVRPPVNSSWPEPVVDLMCRCWDADPSRRPDFSQVSDLLAQFYAMLPEEQVEVDPFGIKTASGIVGEQMVKDMQMSLMQGTTPLPCHITDVAVVAVEITNVPDMCKNLEAYQVASMLSDLFAKFQELGNSWGVCRFQSNGGKYIALAHGNCPCSDVRAKVSDWSPERAVCGYSLALHSSVQDLSDGASASVAPILKIGAHVGSVTFLMGNIHSVEIRGEAVSLASMMATTGLKGRVQVTDALHSKVATVYPGTLRPNVPVVGKGTMSTIILNTVLVADCRAPSVLERSRSSTLESVEDDVACEPTASTDVDMPTLIIDEDAETSGSDSNGAGVSARNEIWTIQEESESGMTQGR